MQHLREILEEIDSLMDTTMDRLPHQVSDLDMYRGKLAGLQLAHATILRKLAELEERRERDTDTDPRCEGCKQPNRTVYTSDQGWINFCINPNCEIRGDILIGVPPIHETRRRGM